MMRQRLLTVLGSVCLGVALTVVSTALGSAAAGAPLPVDAPHAPLSHPADIRVPSQVPVTATVIDVPYRYQGEEDGRDTDQKRHDCGQASVAMAVQYATGEITTVKAIHDYVNVSGNTLLVHLQDALTHWHIDYVSVSQTADISAAIVSGDPVIAVIDMVGITPGADCCYSTSTDPSQHFGRYNVYTEGHWLVLKGISDDGGWVVVNDPNVFGGSLYWYSDGTPKGASRYYPYSEFATAFDAKNVDALRITTPPYVERLDVRLINQPPVLGLSPGQTSHITFSVQNTGDVTLWSGRTGLLLLVGQSDTELAPTAHYSLGDDILPGFQTSWGIEITAPEAPGVYSLYWQMHFLDERFGPILSCRVLVGGSPSDAWPISSGDGSVDYSKLIDAWLRSMLADEMARLKSQVETLKSRALGYVGAFLQRLGADVQEDVLRLLASLWEETVGQCCGASALAPLALSGVGYLLRRRL